MLEAGDITVPLRGEDDNLYSLKLDLGANGYGGNCLLYTSPSPRD